MTIRAGTPADEDSCVAIWLAALEHRDGFVPPESSRERAHTKFRQPIVRLGLAVPAGEIDAPASASARNGIDGIDGNDGNDGFDGNGGIDGFALTVRASNECALLELIAVAPGASARGTGGALLDDAVAVAAASGYLCLDLWVRRGNDRAVALYLSRGFEPTGEHEAHPLGGEPMLRYRLPLG